NERPCRTPSPGHLQHLHTEIKPDNLASPGQEPPEPAGSAPQIKHDVPGPHGQAPGDGSPPPPVQAEREKCVHHVVAAGHGIEHGSDVRLRRGTGPPRPMFKRVRLITGTVQGSDQTRRTATVAPTEGHAYELSYDVVVVGPGSVSRVLPVPGLAERAVGFKTVTEAIFLRNQVLSRMDVAESTDDSNLRRRALTFLFVGGGYAGVEALAELEDLARDACRYYRSVRRQDMRWVLVEAAD